MKRLVPLVNGEVYHILNRSIAEYKVFNDGEDYLRMQQMLRYYQKKPDRSFSHFINLDGVARFGFNNFLNTVSKDKKEIIQIIAYCLMPTHIHLILKQLEEDGISKYFGDILNSYSRFFNTKHKRKGPLWEAKFKNILVNSDEQLLHLTRYIHLNPATAHLVEKAENWQFSSCNEYLKLKSNMVICDYDDLLEIKPVVYKKFVNDRLAYQRELAKIKALILE